MSDRKKAMRWCFASVLVVYLFWSQVKPSNNRVWSDHLAVLPQVEIEGELVTIHNIRNIKYRTTTDFETRYYHKTFDLDRIESVSYAVQNFTFVRGLAHTFVSFGFRGHEGEMEYVAISVEIRSEKKEEFSPLLGMFKRFEITYVIGDERDVIGVRSHIRKDPVRLYPINASHDQMQALFLEMVNRAQSLTERPEFYDTWTNNCTNNIVSHVAKIAPQSVSAYDWRVILPGYSDRAVFTRGLIKTELSYEDVRRESLIRPAPEHYLNDKNGQTVGLRDNFSKVIRQKE